MNGPTLAPAPIAAPVPCVRVTFAPAPIRTSVRVVSGPTTASRATVVVPCSWVLGSRRTSSSRTTVASIQVRRGIDDGDAGAHPGLDGAAVVFRAKRGELDAVVCAFDLPAVFSGHGGDPSAGRAGQAQDVGEVLFALGVVGGDVRERLAEHRGVEGVDTRIDFTDAAFGVRGVFVLADAGDGSVGGSEDPAVPGGIVEDGRQDGHGIAVGFVGGDKFHQQLPGKERHITIGDDDGSAQRSLGVAGVEGLEGRFDGAAGAGHLVLVDDQGCGIEAGDVGGDQVPFVPDDERQHVGVEAACGCECVAYERPSADLVQDLGGPGFHPGTCACGEDDHSGRAVILGAHVRGSPCSMAWFSGVLSDVGGQHNAAAGWIRAVPWPGPVKTPVAVNRVAKSGPVSSYWTHPRRRPPDACRHLLPRLFRP